jgi:hypothetical protein
MDEPYKTLIEKANELSDELKLKRMIISLSKTPKLDAIYKRGEVTFTSEHDSFWGRGKNYAKTFTNPTWKDLLLAAEESIKVTGDHHHVFLEDVKWDIKTRTASFSFGS